MQARNQNIVEMIRRARQEGWALGQFNMSNLETLQAIVLAANDAKSPVIVGVSMGTIRHVGLSYIRGLLQAAHSEANVPLFFHLDHGPDLATIESCVAIGFDSVMIDTSRYSLEENVALVRQVVEFAHDRGVGVEAQIGETWDEETGTQVQMKTDAEEARAFATATGVDYLAVSFGNTPGRWEGEADVDLDVVKEVARLSSVPLVLHGGSSIPEGAIQQAIQLGAAKVNIDVAIRRAVTSSMIASYCRENAPTDPRVAFRAAREAAKAIIMEKMRLFGSVNRAS
jgi:fructose-bisphosphate aldolase class II